MSGLRNWVAKRSAAGIDYYPPEGESLGAIKLRQRIRPLEPVKVVVDRGIARLASIVDNAKVEESEDLVTSEGEHAAIVRVVGVSTVDGQAVEYIVGLVFGDDHYDRFDAYCTDAREFASFRITLRDVIFSHRMSLGQDRSRRFLYDPPADWQGLARGMLVEWYPLDFPRNYSRIVVAPVVPENSTRALLEPLTLAFGRVGGLILDGEPPPERFGSTYGLSGQIHTQHGRYLEVEPKRPTIISTAVLRDERFSYLLRLETRDEHREASTAVFRKLLQSCRPVPHPLARESDLWEAWAKPA
jgi:hypothetical protein